MKEIIVSLITLYQKTLSRDHGWLNGLYPTGHCRYQPTCSEYAKQAIEEYGIMKGTFLAVARVSRCHPWAPIGADPVPARENN